MRSGHLDGVDALLFDVLGTVVNVHGTLVRELKRLALNLGHSTDSEDYVRFAQEWTTEYDIRTQAIAAGAGGPLSVDIMNAEILEYMLQSPPWIHLAAVFTTEQRPEMCQFWHRLDGWPDASSGLHALKRRTIIGTLSNANVKMLVDMSKYADLPWDVVFGGELLGSYKPNPKTFLGAAHHLSLPPSRTAMVAAHADDLRAAARHGMQTVYVRRPTEDIDVLPDGRVLRDTVRSKVEGGEVDVVVDSFDELAKLLG